MSHPQAMRTPDWLICALLCMVLCSTLNGIGAGLAGCGMVFCIWGWWRS